MVIWSWSPCFLVAESHLLEIWKFTSRYQSFYFSVNHHCQPHPKTDCCFVLSYWYIYIYTYIMSYDLCYSLLISIKKKIHVDKNPMLQLLHIPGILRSESSEHSEHCPWRPSMGLARDPRDLWICSWRIFHMVRWRFPTFRGAPVR